MVKTLYFVTGPNPEDLVRQFIDFTRSAEGWAILKNTGHFPLRESESQ